MKNWKWVVTTLGMASLSMTVVMNSNADDGLVNLTQAASILPDRLTGGTSKAAMPTDICKVTTDQIEADLWNKFNIYRLHADKTLLLTSPTLGFRGNELSNAGSNSKYGLHDSGQAVMRRNKTTLNGKHFKEEDKKQFDNVRYENDDEPNFKESITFTHDPQLDRDAGHPNYQAPYMLISRFYERDTSTLDPVILKDVGPVEVVGVYNMANFQSQLIYRVSGALDSNGMPTKIDLTDQQFYSQLRSHILSSDTCKNSASSGDGNSSLEDQADVDPSERGKTGSLLGPHTPSSLAAIDDSNASKGQRAVQVPMTASNLSGPSNPISGLSGE